MLATIFTEMATLLELSGENPFKIRAYEHASRILASSPLSLDEIASNPPAGFGKGLLEKLTEFLNTGKIADYQALVASFPEGLFDLLKVQGLGPKKVKILFQELGVNSLETLEKACKEDKLLTLKGFGQKTQAEVNFTQAPFAVNVIAIFRTITIGSRPGNSFNQLRALHFPQLIELLLQALMPGRGDIVLQALR